MLRPWVLRVLVILGLSAATACGGPRESAIERDPSTAAAARPARASAEPAGKPARPRIVALGDSLTAGYGLNDGQSYPAFLQQRIDAEGYQFEVVNAGVSGDTSAGALRRLEWSLDGDVRVLIVALGGNDGLRGLPVADMKRNLTEIVSRARKRKIAVILAGMEAPPNYGHEYAAEFRAAFREVAERQRVLLIPFLLDKVAGRSQLNQTDGIHPNEQGTRIVSETVWSVLRPVLDQMAAS